MERRIDETVRSLIEAARRSSREVLAALDRAVRSIEPALDAIMFFESREGTLACIYASGSRTEHFAAMQLRIETSNALPLRAFARAQPTSLTKNAAAIMPSDRAALAVPMLLDQSIRGVWYVASSFSTRFASAELLVRAIEHATQPYALALEREADRSDATFDGLTGVLTPRAFRARLHEEVARAKGDAVLSLWFVDTDRFKSINDELGHAVGDTVLQRMAALLRAHAAPEIDLVGRKGGDEFCALIRSSQKLATIARAQGFCEAVRAHDFGISVQVTASIGVAAFPFDAHDAGALLEAADAAMYHAKRTGRDRVAYIAGSSGFALYV